MSPPATAQPIETGNDGGARRRVVPQVAIDAANDRLREAGGALGGVADTIDELFERNTLPFGDNLQGFADQATRRLRSIGDTVGDQDAGELIDTIQRRAAANPGLAIAVGAAAGAAIALLLVRTAPRDASTED